MAKKAVLLSGPHGIGKTTSAKLVTHNLGFHPLEFNASDCRRKADCEIENGIKGRTSNSIKELVSHSPHQNKTVLIMDEVDGMSSGDRGGIADLIANIKISKIPIICICNDHNSQKLKSLVNHCLLLHYLKPTKEQENYITYRPSSANIDKKKEIIELNLRLCAAEPIGDGDIMDVQEKEKKEKEVRKLKELILLACAAESIGDGDIVDVQMRRYQQLLLSENISFASCITPAALLYGQRTPLEEEKRNFNSFGSWLGNSTTMGKNYRLLEGLRAQFCASPNHYNIGRYSSSFPSLFFGYGYNFLLWYILSTRISYAEAVKEVVKFISMKDFDTIPKMSKFKGEAVKEVVEFLHTYSISMEDFVTILEMSKFKGLPNPLDDTSAKAASRKAYSSQKLFSTDLLFTCSLGAWGLLKSALPEALIAGTRSADLSTLAIKTIHDKWVAAMVQVVEDTVAEGIAENEEENPSDTEEDQEPDNLFDIVKMVKTVCTDKFIVRKFWLMPFRIASRAFHAHTPLHCRPPKKSVGPPPDFPEEVFYLPPGAIPKPLGDVKLPLVVYNFGLSGPAKNWLLKHFGNQTKGRIYLRIRFQPKGEKFDAYLSSKKMHLSSSWADIQAENQYSSRPPKKSARPPPDFPEEVFYLPPGAIPKPLGDVKLPPVVSNFALSGPAKDWLLKHFSN
ncbi:hypothetical protein BUALT_Bualt15G0139800 [Buddleja alternifolia]|uniref:AAA+ ATPase domain-containing protein n=1 Tax=Buddleja alternifolia TaxID=168488 RepID=A0AAV6WFE8_9LAMI|nr:hypothetical protein BUALT_Bualt15G0139800 [Buddleja alternifolia]